MSADTRPSTEWTPEQAARDMLERIGVENAQSFTSGNLVELANLIASADETEDAAMKRLTALGVKRIEVVNGKVEMDLTLAQDVMRTFAGAGMALLDSVDAENYVEMQFGHHSLPAGGRILLTIQRCLGKSPNEKRREAEAERDALRGQINELRAALQQIRDDFDHEEQSHDHQPFKYGRTCRVCLAERTLAAALHVTPERLASLPEGSSEAPSVSQDSP